MLLFFYLPTFYVFQPEAASARRISSGWSTWWRSSASWRRSCSCSPRSTRSSPRSAASTLRTRAARLLGDLHCLLGCGGFFVTICSTFYQSGEGRQFLTTRTIVTVEKYRRQEPLHWFAVDCGIILMTRTTLRQNTDDKNHLETTSMKSSWQPPKVTMDW